MMTLRPDLNVPGQLDRIGQDDIVAHKAVVSDVGIGHEQAVGPDHGFPHALHRTAVDGYALAKSVVVADSCEGLFALVGDVLRLAADHGMRMHVVAGTHFRVGSDDAMGLEMGLIADFGIRADDHVRADADINAQFRRGINDRARMNFTGHYMSPLSATAAENSPWQTTAPSTSATPRIFQMFILFFS